MLAIAALCSAKIKLGFGESMFDLANGNVADFFTR